MIDRSSIGTVLSCLMRFVIVNRHHSILRTFQDSPLAGPGHQSELPLAREEARSARVARRANHVRSRPPVRLGPDLFFQRERGHQLSVALDVGRRPDGRLVGVGRRRLPAAADAAPAAGRDSVAVVASVGLGQLGQVDARPWKRRTSSA